MADTRTIVVGYDGSDAAQTALAVAATRAGRDGEVVVVHTVVPATPPAEWWDARVYADIVKSANEAGERMLDAAKAGLAGGVKVRTQLASGAPAHVLEEIADGCGADEIVVGSRGLGRVQAALGSVSHALLHVAKRPVVVVAPPDGNPPAGEGAVVVGYDGSEPSRAALAYAADTLDGRHLFVVCASERVPGYLGDPYRQHAIDAATGRARECAEEAAGQLPAGTSFELEVLDGPPSEALAQVADTRRADEIVIGSRGFGAIRGSIGSVSHDLIREAGRPVVVLPAQ